VVTNCLHKLEVQVIFNFSVLREWTSLASTLNKTPFLYSASHTLTVGSYSYRSLFTTVSRPALGPTQSPIQWVPGALSLGVKRPGREADHSPPSSAEVNNARSYTSTPQYVFMAWCLVKHRDNLPSQITLMTLYQLLKLLLSGERWSLHYLSNFFPLQWLLTSNVEKEGKMVLNYK
jgi:hypothetical protein